jgi:hypothetical protein
MAGSSVIARTAAAAAALAAVAALTAGCKTGGTTASGTSAPTTSLTKAQLWDPCTLPSDAVASTGVDVNTMERDPVPDDNWKSCSWRGKWYFLTSISQTYTLDETIHRALVHGATKVYIPGRDAYTYYLAPLEDGAERDCHLVFSTKNGGTIDLETSQVDIHAQPPMTSCQAAAFAANKLNSYLPQ